MKYQAIPKIVDAYKYEKGMEDGFGRCDSQTCGIFRRFDAKCSECASGRPYIETIFGTAYLDKNDYIVKYENTDIVVYDESTFFNLFEALS